MPVRITLSAGRSTATRRRAVCSAKPPPLPWPRWRAISQPSGLIIKVFDCYRPTRAVANFVRWARDLKDTAGKAEFYPDVDKRTLFRDGYIASQSGHSRGSTIDMTLANDDGRELDMGTPFDFFSPKSWPADPTVTPRTACQPHAARDRDAAAAAFGLTIANGGTSRCAASRFRRPISIFR